MAKRKKALPTTSLISPEFDHLPAQELNLTSAGGMVEIETEDEMEAALAKIAAASNVFDISAEDFFGRRASEPQEVHVMGAGGQFLRSLGAIGSHEDIQALMLRHNMLRPGSVEPEILARLNSNKPAPAPKEPEYPAPPAQALYSLQNGRAEHVADIPVAQFAEETEYYEEVAAGRGRKKAATAVKERKVPDFSSIKLSWLNSGPKDPEIAVEFVSEIGEFSTYYHHVIESEAIVYLCYDKRCRAGRFMPKLHGGLVKMFIGEQEYTGSLWPAAKMEVGVIEILPFIKSIIVEEPEDQNNY